MKEQWKALVARLGGERGLRRWLVVLGLVGVLLIGLSEWLPHGEKTVSTQPTAVTAAELEQALEQRITALISGLDGIGQCRVMVTLENGVQQVYAAEETYNTAADGSSGSHRVLTVDTANGPVGLPVTQLQPVVRGVAVVCAGGENAHLAQQVTALISAACNISSHRVCVMGNSR